MGQGEQHTWDQPQHPKSPRTEPIPCGAEEKEQICWVSPLNRFAAFQALGSKVQLFQVPRQQIFSLHLLLLRILGASSIKHEDV